VVETSFHKLSIDFRFLLRGFFISLFITPYINNGGIKEIFWDVFVKCYDMI